MEGLSCGRDSRGGASGRGGVKADLRFRRQIRASSHLVRGYDCK